MHHFVLHFATHFVDDLIYGYPKYSQHGSWDCGVDRPNTTLCDRDSGFLCTNCESLAITRAVAKQDSMLGYATLRETQEGSWMFREVSHGHGLQADLKNDHDHSVQLGISLTMHWI